MSDIELEDFVEALLHAQRLMGASVRHVAHVERWGVRGDKQEGIDFYGRFSDGTLAAWQVKQTKKLTQGDVRKFVAETTFGHAAEFYLVFGRVATVAARREILEHRGWTLLDRRALTETARLLPAVAQRELIDRFWGPTVRRHFLSGTGDAFVSFRDFKASRVNQKAIVNDVGALAGREAELEHLVRAINSSSPDSRQVTIVSGPGGRGKSRVITEALARLTTLHPHVLVGCLAPMRTFDSSAMQELHAGPGLVVIDDAHADPSALRPLLAFLREHPEVQLVLGSRPSGVRQLEDNILLAGFTTQEFDVIALNELDQASARQLVQGLLDGLELSFQLRNYLAAQACHSPHIAVILTGLIRRGELSGAIAVDANLRRTVLARYQELLVPDPADNQDAERTSRVIATYACLQPVSAVDDALHRRVALFCDLSATRLAKIRKELTDAGVLLEQQDGFRVIPDLLADHVVEAVAIVDGFDTQFATDIWEAFSTDHRARLLSALGDLAWRLRQQGDQTLELPIWTSINERLRSKHASRLLTELKNLEPLSATQPLAVVAVLDDLRTHLDALETAGHTEDEDLEDADDQLYLRIWPLARRRSISDVRAQLPELYATAALHDPRILEAAVDALLDLAATETRPMNANPGHARRVLADRLGNLARMPDVSFAERIVDVVANRCARVSEAESAQALRALEPLLAKEELTTVQSSTREISFQSRLMAPDAMRKTRDQVRDLLRGDAITGSVRLSGIAVELLRKALQVPHGYFGNSVPADSIVAWESDDLATIESLTTLANQTRSPVIRSLVADAVRWHTEHAESLEVQRACHTLIYRLDPRGSIPDELAERVTGRQWRRLGKRPPAVPSLSELRATKIARLNADSERTDEAKQVAERERIRAELEDARKQRLVADANLAIELLAFGSHSGMLSAMDAVLRDASTVGGNFSSTFRSIWLAIADKSPEQVPIFVKSISRDFDPGPLDGDLPILLECWRQFEAQAVLIWAEANIRHARAGVRGAIASFLERSTWMPDYDDFLRLWRVGVHDPDPVVRQGFLAAGGSFVRADPGNAIAEFLSYGPLAATASNLLIGAVDLSEEHPLGTDDPSVDNLILELISRAGLDQYLAQELLTKIAKRNPHAVLDFMRHEAQSGADIPTDMNELASVFGSFSAHLSAWLRENLSSDVDSVRATIAGVLNDRLTDAQAGAISRIVPELDSEELIALLRVLSALSQWVPQHVDLAETCLDHGAKLAVTERVEQELAAGHRLSSWSFSGGASAELDEALRLCSIAARTTSHLRLRLLLEQSASTYRARIEEATAEYEADEDW